MATKQLPSQAAGTDITLLTLNKIQQAIFSPIHSTDTLNTDKSEVKLKL
jgi:hypothetical protein